MAKAESGTVEGKTPFIIAFVGRQGSSYLEGLIDSHPDAVCSGELFSPAAATRRGFWATLKGEPKTFIRSGTTDVEQYLVREVHKSKAKAIGFKLPLYSMREHPSLVPALRAHNYKVLLLTRENLLDQYISMRLAQENHAWTSQQGSWMVRRFVGDIEDAEKRFAVWEQENAETRAMVEGLPTLPLVYERLDAQMPDVLNFLGLPQAPTKSKYTRQRQGTQETALRNYAEMKAHFSTTRWAGMFED